MGVLLASCWLLFPKNVGQEDLTHAATQIVDGVVGSEHNRRSFEDFGSVLFFW